MPPKTIPFGAPPIAKPKTIPFGAKPALPAPAPATTKSGLLERAANIATAPFPGTKQIGESLGTIGVAAKEALTGHADIAKNVLKTQVSVPRLIGAYTAAGATVAPGGAGLGAKTIQGLALGYGSDVADGDANGKDSFMPGIGTAVGGALPFASKLVGFLGKQVLSKTAGTGTEVLERALKNPKAIDKAVSAYATTPEAKQTLVDKAKGAISTFLHQRSVEYGSSMESLAPKGALDTQSTAAASFADKIKTFGGSISKEGALRFKNTALTSADQKNLEQAWDTISNWDDGSVKGSDHLRQAIDNLMKDFKLTGNTRANLVLGDVKDAVRGHISENVPGYEDTLSQYGQKTMLANNVLKELNLGGNARASTQLNTIMRLFKKDPSIRTNLAKIMGPKASDDLLDEISGAILSEWLPPGVVGNAARAVLEGTGAVALGVGSGIIPGAAAGGAALAATSPRLVGKAATLTGRALQSGIGTALGRAATIGAAKVPFALPSNQ